MGRGGVVRYPAEQLAVDTVEIERQYGNVVVLYRKGVSGRYFGTISRDGRFIQGHASWYGAGERWSAEEKFAMVVATAALNEAERGEYCRQRGLYPEQLQRWPLTPTGTEGYKKAEVTLGGVDTRALSSQTLEARQQPGLYFIGEVVDVTGWLGGYNFQWAWASGHAAGLAC